MNIYRGKIAFLATLLCLLMAVPAFAGKTTILEPPKADLSKPFDLERSVKRALEANPTILGAKANVKGAEYGRRAAIGGFLPTVDVTYGYTNYDRKPTYGTRDRFAATASVSQPLFTGFNLLNTYQKSKLSKDYYEAALRQTELSIILNVQTNFLALLKARMNVKSAEDSVNRLASQVKVIKAFFDVGLRPRVEVLQAEVDLANAKQDLLKAKNSVSIQEAQLNTLLNLPLDADVQYVGSLNYLPFSMPLKDCLNKAYSKRPDLVVGAKSVDMAIKDAKIKLSEFYPQVYGSYSYTKVGNNYDLKAKADDGWPRAAQEYWSTGINLSWNIFDGGSDYYAYKQLMKTVLSLEESLNNTRLSAGFSVKQALLNLKEAADRIGVARKSVESAKESYRMAVARYQAQVGTNTDVLDAQARVTSSEALLITALSDYNTALASLFAAMGEKNPGLKTN